MFNKEEATHEINKMVLTRILKLFEVKSIVTIAMTIGLLVAMFGNYNTPSEVLGLYCTSYGAIITYFFTRKE